MTTPGSGGHAALASAQRQHASLDIQIEALQATLVRLLQDVVDAEARLADTRSAAVAEGDGARDQAASAAARDTALQGDALCASPEPPASTVATAPSADPGRGASHGLAALRQANERLVLAALGAQELRAAAERAQQRQNAFMAAVAGELSNPLAPIRIATSMLGRLPGEEPLLPRVRRVIEQQMSQMSQLVGRLVEASTDENVGLSLTCERVDMVTVVDAAVAACRPMLQQHRMSLEWRAPVGAVPTCGDASRLEQIVANLIDHACTHTPDGGRIRISLLAHEQTLTLLVADNGLGIPAPALPDVFDPFALDLHALDFNGVGVGVGLSVARALVHAHEGSITAHSEGVRRGSEFVVTLPIAPAAEPDAGLATGLAPDAGTNGPAAR